jgi:SAM-dependent methyltransferase
MFAETQTETYFARMKSSVGDKAHMVDFVLPGRTLDVGAGGGEFAAILNENGHDVHALDGSAEAVKRCRQLGIPTVEAYTHETSKFFPADMFNTITCSSILHEVYSYGSDEPGSALTLDSVRRTLAEFAKVLTVGGHLIIRDGVMPANWDQMVEIHMKDADGMRLTQKYLDMIPFRGTNGQMRTVNLTVKEGTTDVLVGNMESVMEFLYTYTWGEDVFPRETQELYGVFTLTDYTEFLEENGFRVVEASEYIQPGYPANLEQKVALYADGKPVAFPNSNCLIVAERI